MAKFIMGVKFEVQPRSEHEKVRLKRCCCVRNVFTLNIFFDDNVINKKL